MLTLQSDLVIAFDQIGIKFQSIVNEHREQLKQIAKEAVDHFDFEKVLTAHIEAKITEGLEKAFSEIDLSDNLAIKIWDEIEKRLGE